MAGQQDRARRGRAGMLWGLAPLLTFGLLGWLPFTFWGARDRRPSDLAAALGYAAWAGTGLAYIDTAYEDLAGTAILVLIPVATVHAAVTGVRRHTAPSRQERALEAARDRITRRDRARALLAREPQVARELGIGRPDLDLGYDDGGLLDVNSAPAHVLARELGWPAAEAEEVVAVRDRVGGFAGPTELIALTRVPPPRVDSAGDRLVYLPV